MARNSPSGFVDVSGATHRQELAWFMKSTCLIRRLKRDVLQDLPKKTRCTLEVDVQQGKMKKKFKPAGARSIALCMHRRPTSSFLSVKRL